MAQNRPARTQGTGNTSSLQHEGLPGGKTAARYHLALFPEPHFTPRAHVANSNSEETLKIPIYWLNAQASSHQRTGHPLFSLANHSQRLTQQHVP